MVQDHPAPSHVLVRAHGPRLPDGMGAGVTHQTTGRGPGHDRGRDLPMEEEGAVLVVQHRGTARQRHGVQR